jgi:hypothetical protein
MRIEWCERYSDQQIHVIADETPDGFTFAERESWDVCWVEVAPTPDLVAKASFFLEAAARPDYDGPYVFRHKPGDHSVIRVFMKPQCDLTPENVSAPAHPETQVPSEPENPWIAESFYLFAIAVIVLLGTLAAVVLHQLAALPLTLGFAPLLIVLLGTFRLIQGGHLTQTRFVKLILEALKLLRISMRPEAAKRPAIIPKARSRE